MPAIIIGAGRGRRLGDRTDERPKALVPCMGKPILEWILDAFAEAGIARRDVIYISGYKEEILRSRYPEFTYVRNDDWEHNNILLSLMCARQHLESGALISYSDIVYEGRIVSELLSCPADIALGSDTDWRRRYRDRSEHPESDAEKLRAAGPRVLEVSRRIASDRATGEFIGVLKVTPAGAHRLLRAFDDAAERFAGREWREGRTFERAYLIDLIQEMLEQGVMMECRNTHGGYMEIDTLQDLHHATQWWHERENGPPRSR